MIQYEKLNFVNGSPPALNATTLNYMEDGITAATEGVTAVEKTVKNNKAETDNALKDKPGFDDVYTVEEADEHFLSKYDAGNTYATKANLATKANTATTLEGYGITDAYTKTEVDNAISGKIDNTEGSVKRENIDVNAIGTEEIDSGAVDTVNIADRAVTTDKLADEVKTSINSKYDSSNVETGSGELTVNNSNAEKIKSASFDYQKIGSFVHLNVYIAFNSFTPESLNSSITFSGLPFVCKNQVTPREMCVTSQKKQLIWGIASNTSALTLLYMSMDEFVDGEKLSFSICYKIS